jgi:hypothetical protein
MFAVPTLAGQHRVCFIHLLHRHQPPAMPRRFCRPILCSCRRVLSSDLRSLTLVWLSARLPAESARLALAELVASARFLDAVIRHLVDGAAKAKSVAGNSAASNIYIAKCSPLVQRNICPFVRLPPEPLLFNFPGTPRRRAH